MPPERQSALTRKLIADGLTRAVTPEPSSLHDAFYNAALETLRTGAPSLAERSRKALAGAIALKCQGAVKQANRSAA